jgi:hypothetical protein
MKVELNLSTAFTLRKRIKALAGELYSVMRWSPYITEEEKVDETLQPFENGSLEDTYHLYVSCLEANEQLSNLIEEKNNEGKKLLCGLNKINAQIELMTSIATALKSGKVSKTRNPVTGVWETITLKKITDFDAAKEVENLKQLKVHQEDRLSIVNGQTKFSFELNDEVYHRIYGG